MTTRQTRQGQAPGLDRLISVVVELDAPGLATYRFEDWALDGRTLSIGLRDQDGAELPLELTTPLANGGLNDDTFTLENYGVERVYGQPSGRQLALDTAPTLPVDTELRLTLPIEVTTTRTQSRRIWARRYERPAAATRTNENRSIFFYSTEWTIRAGMQLREGDRFTDDQGEVWTISGIADLGRGRYQVLSAKRVE